MDGRDSASCAACGLDAFSPTAQAWSKQTVQHRRDGSTVVTNVWVQGVWVRGELNIRNFTMKKKVLESGVLPLDKTA